MYIIAFAKINLYLDVVDKKEDGYHNLKMVMLPLELHDLIEIERSPYSMDSFVTCDHVELQETKYNLINITISKLRNIYRFTENFNVAVHKEIPISAGLGGGSSNAAAVLKAFNKILQLKIDDEKMLEIGKTIGADVPFCLYNKPAYVEGIGEKLTPINVMYQYQVLIIKPSKGLSTKKVFDVADEMVLKHSEPTNIIKALETGDDDLLAKSMFNSLEEPSISMVGEIQDIKNRLYNDGFKMVLMSGSGSSVYALTRDVKLAKKYYKIYDKEGYEVYLTRTMKWKNTRLF